MSDETRENPPRLVLVTGPSGAGRSTAIAALEDLGFEVIDNLPLSLLDRLVTGGAPRPLALGIDVRNRDFSTDGVVEAIDRLDADPAVDATLLYLDCRPGVLIRRYSETRRRHPLAPEGAPGDGIARETDLLQPLRDRADMLIDTSDMTPHELRDEIGHLLGRDPGAGLAVSVVSFSYKRGLPRGTDMVFDVRFLRNPHWEDALRPLTGRDPAVAEHVEGDPRFEPFFGRVADLALSLLPEYAAEGKTHFAIGLGCTGGRHRSVATAEKLARTLAEHGWRVSTRHRELERRGLEGPGAVGTNV